MSALRRPPELDHLGLGQGRSAVVEASAGTGKTYLLEHIVLDLIITGRARLDQILVVTFTERATAELVTRIRRKIDDALAASENSSGHRDDAESGDSPIAQPIAQPILHPIPPAIGGGGWTIDAAARARLIEARHSFDQATIATIHAFCQRILTDEPLSTGRLIGQTQVDGQQAFGETFRDVLRRTLATDSAHKSYLDAYLNAGGRADSLETLLYRAATARGTWASVYDEGRLVAAAERLAALNLDAIDVENALRRFLHHSSVSAMLRRLRRLKLQAQESLTNLSWGRLLACLDAEVDVFQYFETLAVLPTVPPPVEPFRHLSRMLLDPAPSLEEAVVQRFLPVVVAELRRRKLTDGLYDFDDMIRAVDEALDGDQGAALAEKLRDRFLFALVDEAQDIEPAQWNIFRRVFLLGDVPRPLILIGDPKQAIYGFRGADVHTYVAARDEIIGARGGVLVPLARNHRSHGEVVDAYNAVLDHQAAPRYFSTDAVAYDRPVVAAKPRLGDGPGATLLRIEPPAGTTAPARIGTIRRALLEAIVRQLETLRAAPPAARTPLSEIYVLTRSNVEAREVAARLHAAGIANVLYRPDYIFRSNEATHVRALLLAIADPGDRARRLGAWLTPFFDISLTALAAGGADPPPDHPLVARLIGWKTLADAHAYDVLWSRIVDDSGIARRLRLAPSGLRALTNYRHVFDLLHDEAAVRPTSVEDLATLLAAGLRRPTVSEDDTQRLETEADAVRIMTTHAAKGLEADIVFVYGGFTGRRFWKGVHTLQQDRTRQLCVGKPKRPRLIELIDATRHEEEQRLLYVAMTRARRHLYLPFFPATESGDRESEAVSGDFDPFKRVSGAYLHVNKRLRVLAGEPRAAALFRTIDVPLTLADPHAAAAAAGAGAGGTSAAEALARWSPPADVAALGGSPHAPSAAMEKLRLYRRGFAITSYSRLKEAHGGYHPPGADAFDLTDGEAPPRLAPLEMLDVEALGEPARGHSGAKAAAANAATANADTLPGGVATGLFLHAILEKVALAPLAPLAPLATWQRQPEVRRLVEGELRRWDRDPAHFAAAARLVHAALTVPILLPEGTVLPGIARADRVRREVDFLFPLPHSLHFPPAFSPLPATSPEDALVHERGFVRGFLDVVFEHAGRVYFADWKSDALPRFDATSMRAHIDKNYDWQVRLYTLAVVRMLGIADEATYQRRFGGLVYLFLRGVTPQNTRDETSDQTSDPTSDGVHVDRPSYADVQAWSADLATLRLTAGDSGGGTP